MARYNYTISQTKKIERLLKKDIRIILETTAKDTVQKLKVYIKRYWYDRYSPQDYDRTSTLLEAVSYKVYGNSVEIFIDETKLIYASQAGWGQHVGFDGEDFSSGLIEFIENGRFDSGKTGYIGNPRIGKGSGAVQKTLVWLNKYINNDIRKQLSVLIGKKVL